MQNILIYGGIAINIIGALLLAIFAIQTWNQYRQAHQMPLRMDEIRSKWADRRKLSFGLILGGSLIAIIGCFI